MQTACWQLCFSDRFTGARNPARLPTTIQSRRIRYAPTIKQPGELLSHPFYHRRAYNRCMRTRVDSCARSRWRRCFFSVPDGGHLWAEAETKITVVVKTLAGRPLDRAEVILRWKANAKHPRNQLRQEPAHAVRIADRPGWLRLLPGRAAGQHPDSGERQRVPDLRADLRHRRRGKNRRGQAQSPAAAVHFALKRLKRFSASRRASAASLNS
jgi:hypothetical protein